MPDQELPPIPFSPPRIDQAIIDEVVAALKSGWITTGPRVRRFEAMLSAYGGHSQTLCLNSCTAGLELMLRWYGIGPGDEVIVPAYTYSATANAVEHCGARVVMADVGEDFNIDPTAIAACMSPHTKVIIPVDIGGWPCDYDAIKSVVQDYVARKGFDAATAEQEKLGRPLILSDSAHSLGAWYKGKRAGALTDASVFSFHAVKNLSTAEGGAICLNLPDPFDNEAEWSRLRIKGLHGQTKDALAKAQAGAWEYDIVEAGYKCNMTDIQAAMGIVELGRYDDSNLLRRRQIFELYSKVLSNYDWAVLPPYDQDGRVSSYHVFLLRLHGFNEEARAEVIRYMASMGIATNVHFKPLPLLSHYASNGYHIADFPMSYANYRSEISLPVYFDLSDADCHRVVSALAEAVDACR
jgi:dTDP-4-amino-4,6-dideoxygalactose transaminase